MEWKREIITPKTAVKHPSTCSGMIKVGPFLFVAGQIAMFEDRTVVQGYKDIDEEGRRMLQADVNWGAHFREDHPERSDAFQFHTLLSMTDFGAVRFGTRPVDMSIHASGGEHAEQFRIMPRKY